MLKLIRKDFLAFRYIYIFQLFGVLALMSFGLFFDTNGNMTFVAMMLYPLVLPTVLLISDQGYMTLCHSMPISRKEYVGAKYIGGLLSALIILGIGCIYGFLVSEFVVTGGVEFQQLFSLQGLGVMIVPILLISSITFPVYFAFSKEKGSLVLIIFFNVLLFSLIVGLVYAEKNMEAYIQHNDQEILPIMMYRLTAYINRIGARTFGMAVVGGSVVLLLTSLLISLKIMAHKDIGGA